MKSDPLIHPDPPARWQRWNRPLASVETSRETRVNLFWVWGRSNLCIMHGCLLSCTMGHTHTHTTVTLIVWADLSCSIDSTSSFSLVWSKQGALTERSVFVWCCLHTCFHPRACVAATALLWRKLFGPSALQIHLEFMTLTAVCFFLSGEEKKNGGMGEWWLTREAVIYIGEDWTRGQKRKKGRKKNSAGKVAEDCSHSRPCGLRAAWLVEHLRHIGQ